MNNLQLFLFVGIPSLLVALAWFNNNISQNQIKETLKEVKDTQKEHARKFDENRDASHRDSLEILRAMTEMHERLAVVESKQGVR